MAAKGDWVRIHRVLLSAQERTANLPEDTKKALTRLPGQGLSLLAAFALCAVHLHPGSPSTLASRLRGSGLAYSFFGVTPNRSKIS